MVNTIKQIAKDQNSAEVQCAFMFGKVLKEKPLKIRVNNRFDIEGDMIVVMWQFIEGWYPTHYHMLVKGGPRTEEEEGGSGDAAYESHSHILKNDYQTNDDEESEYYYGLKKDDKVVLLRNYGGQQYLVLGRMPK